MVEIPVEVTWKLPWPVTGTGQYYFSQEKGIFGTGCFWKIYQNIFENCKNAIKYNTIYITTKIKKNRIGPICKGMVN